MKRLLVLLLLSAIGLTSGGYRAQAHKQPDLPPLPDFDQRRDRRPDHPVLPPRKAAAAALLHERVPGLKIVTDKLFESPQFVASPNGFLTGPRGRGKSVPDAPAAAGNDHPHGPLRAFLNEHSALFGFGPEALDAAALKRDYVTTHNGVRTVVWEQHLDDIPVLDSVFLAHITRDGELVNVSSRFLADPAAAARGRGARPRNSAGDAVLAAAQSLGEALALTDLATLDNQPPGPHQKQRFKAPR